VAVGASGIARREDGPGDGTLSPGPNRFLAVDSNVPTLLRPARRVKNYPSFFLCFSMLKSFARLDPP
jgi:hypothetical protein